MTTQTPLPPLPPDVQTAIQRAVVAIQERITTENEMGHLRYQGGFPKLGDNQMAAIITQELAPVLARQQAALEGTQAVLTNVLDNLRPYQETHPEGLTVIGFPLRVAVQMLEGAVKELQTAAQAAGVGEEGREE